MKTICLYFLLFCFALPVGFSQAEMKFMVYPTKHWADQHGYLTEFEFEGVAMDEIKLDQVVLDSSFVNLQTDIGTALRPFGFEVQDLATAVAGAKEDLVKASRRRTSNGTLISESYEKLMARQIRADVIIRFDITWGKKGPDNQLILNLQAVDSYSLKVISEVRSITNSYASTQAEMVRNAMVANLDNFVSKIQEFVDKIESQGREITSWIEFPVDSDFDIYTIPATAPVDYENLELLELIEQWAIDNAQGNRALLGDYGNDFLEFDYIYIPTVDENGNAVSAERFMRGLRRLLSESLGVRVKLEPEGLGKVIVIIEG